MLKHNGYITLPFTSLKEQLELEKDMRNRGINRFQKRLRDHKKRGEESFTNYGKTLLSNSIRPLSEAILLFVNEKLGDDECILIKLISFISSLSK